MCGITGILKAGDKSVITHMTKTLHHRGPDDEGFYHDQKISLGHCRLSINDLASGHQPMACPRNRVQLICNGEIYNSPELRKKYQAQGYPFRSKTDIEVILPLYLEHGEDCARFLQGMFAFVIWDPDKDLLLMARDHLGQKPLFFYAENQTFLFASEIKALLAADIIQREIDLNGLWHYISLRYIPDRYSLFKHIQKLPAAHSLVYQNGQYRIKRFWQPDFNHKLNTSIADIEAQLDQLLQKTVSSHLLSDVRVGAFLSGGLDSGTISAIMAQQMNKPLASFSIGVKEQGFNELPYARMVAERYHMEAHEKVVQADLIHLLPAMVYHLDEPSDPFAAGVYLVAREASREVKVVLTGDGGDENFAGYDRFAGNQLVNHYSVLPAWFRRFVVAKAIGCIPESFGYKSLKQKAIWFNQMSFFSEGRRYAESMSFLRFTQQAKEQLFTHQARQQITDYDSIGKILTHYDSDQASHPVDRMLYTDLMTRMPDHLLAIVDRMTMAHSLESRAPLMDYKLVEFAASIPADMKLKGRDLKHIFKQVAKRHLPHELINREKQGFGFPLAHWMRTDLKPFISNLFKQSRFIELGLFNESYVNRLLQEHVEGKADHNFRLWILINLEIWYRLYFEDQTQASLQDTLETLYHGSTASCRDLKLAV